MQTIYKLQPQEINEDFMRFLRSTFEHNTRVKITITVETDDSDFNDAHIPRASDKENTEIGAMFRAMSDEDKEAAFTKMIDL